MKGAIIDKLKKDSKEMRLYQEEWLILQTTILIEEVMEEKGIRKKELAERLGRSKGYITQLLDGRANMTLRTVADVMWALDCSLTVDVCPLGFETSLDWALQYALLSGADFWTQEKTRLVRTQESDVVEKEQEAVDQLKLAG